MTSIRSTFKTLGRAAIVAVAFGVTATAATSAFAQSGPSVNFSIQLPSGGNNGQSQSPSLLGKGSANDRNWNGNGGNGGYGYRCLTNREVRQGIADYGYRQVEVTRELRRDRVEVQAVYGSWVYSMRVDKCTGYVDQAQRIGRANGGGWNGGNGGNGGWNNGGGYNGGGYNGGGYNDGGFGFQFNFGN